MAKTLRVHSLAKELGVTSKDLIAKCAAEGIVLKNHMAAISIGLSESIREWFSVGEDVTSVEVARPVDLDKVLRTPKRRKITHEMQAESEDAGESGAPPVGTATEVAVLAEPPPAESTMLPTETFTTEPEAEPQPREMAATVAEAAPSPSDAPVEPEDAEEADAAVAEPPPPLAELPPPPPKPIRPAGPQLVPKPAELKGPRVVRVESPEPETLRAPRRARPMPALPGMARPPEVGAETPAARRGRTRPGPAREADRKGGRSPRRRGTDLEVSGERLREWREQDWIERKERLASATGHGLRERRAAEKRRSAAASGGAHPVGRKTEIELTEPIVLREFCAAVGMPFVWVTKKMLEQSGTAPRSLMQTIDAGTAELLVEDLDITLKVVKARTALEALRDEFAARERTNLQPRPPVVAMLGHVDHGKTSLLDRIRQTNVAAGEAGGITQHIGASRIVRGDWRVAFVDTPGHEAFTAMRARGADLTDVVVLVVAADDGVMPQTVEALSHARAAGVQIVVALNKIDLPGVDLNKIYGQLAEHDLAPAEWGGHTDVIKTSATSGEGIDELIEHLSTLSEVMDLRADPDVPAQATVIEAHMREGQGVVAQVLVREGTLQRGQTVVCGPGVGRIRALRDERGCMAQSAEPGTPVEVSGLDELPQAGDQMYVMKDLKRAKDIAADVRAERRAGGLLAPRKARGLEDLLKAGEEGQVPELAVIVKTDVSGNVETLREKLGGFPADKAKLNMLHVAVGAITEADISLAQASSALVIGYNVVAEDRARQLADQVGVEIRTYRIIYEVVEDLYKALEGLLEPLRKPEHRGSAEVRQVFHVSRFGMVAGCYVSDGVVKRAHKVRLVRDGRIIVEEAGIASLKRFKDDAREVRSGLECGIKIEGFDDVKPGDMIEALEILEVAQQLV